MCRSLMPFLCLLTMLLTGCPSAPPAGEAESGEIPALTMVRSADLFSDGVDFLALSEDGSTYIVGNKDEGVGLYRASDHVLLERYYERKDEPSATPGDTGLRGAKAIVFDLGYIDANTWHFTEKTLGENDIRLHIRTIHPSRQISVLSMKEPPTSAIVSNKNYIAYNSGLIDWRAGKYYPGDSDFFPNPQCYSIPTLTSNNMIITFLGENIVIFDPLNGRTGYLELWEKVIRFGKRVVVTPDNRYVIGLSTTSRKCTLWNWFTKKEIGHCSERLREISGKHIEYREVLTLSRDGKLFAVGVDDNVRVYRIEPFRLELEVATPGPVARLALSDDGWLAAYDYKGFLRVWNVATGSLAGQHSLFDGKTIHGTYVPEIAFQPGSGKLFTTAYGAITVFEIPKQSAQQEAESDSGTQKE
ncbi:MAG: hypothetical protein LBK55_05900 [Azoarcus sp.]|nr:hypothetical protein [Azoarcus sp.]